MSSDKTREMTAIFWSDARRSQAQELLENASHEAKEQTTKNEAANLEVYERRRDSYGRWLRTGKRITSSGRDVVSVSVPNVLAAKIREEATDVNYPYSRMIVVLAQLGLDVWQKKRAEVLMDSEPGYIPSLVRVIVQNALNKKEKPSLVQRKWKAGVHEALLAESERLKKSRRKKQDATAIALEQFQGE